MKQHVIGEDGLPNTLNISCKRRPNGWWSIGSPDHIGLFVVCKDEDLEETLNSIPKTIAKLIELDGTGRVANDNDEEKSVKDSCGCVFKDLDVNCSNDSCKICPKLDFEI